MDVLNVLDLGLEENELQLLFLKMFDPKRKGILFQSKKYIFRK